LNERPFDSHPFPQEKLPFSALVDCCICTLATVWRARAKKKKKKKKGREKLGCLASSQTPLGVKVNIADKLGETTQTSQTMITFKKTY